MLELVYDAVVSLGGDVGQYSWVIQEKTKGNKISVTIPFTGVINSGSRYMGWGFNLMDPVSASDPVWYDPVSIGPGAYMRSVKTSTEVANVTYSSGNIARSPLFMTGWGSYSNGNVRLVDPSTTTGPGWIENLYSDSLGNSTATNHRNQILAEAIPALSLPVGANSASKFNTYGTRNFNISVTLHRL